MIDLLVVSAAPCRAERESRQRAMRREPKTAAGRAWIRRAVPGRVVTLLGQVEAESTLQVRQRACSTARRSDAAHSQGGACSPAARGSRVMTTPEGTSRHPKGVAG